MKSSGEKKKKQPISFFLGGSKSFSVRKNSTASMMAVAAAQKNREMFAIKKSYSIEVSSSNSE